MRKNASLEHRRLHLVQILDSADRATGHYCFTTDMAEELKAREEKQRRERLEIVNKELEQFAHHAAHDLQAPLRTMAIYSKLLVSQISTQIGPTGEEYLNYISSAAERMQKLISSLLAYAKAGAAGIPTEEVDTGVALNQAMKHLSAEIERSQAEIHRTTLPRIDGHQFLLTQLFQNLLGNAIKYRKENTRLVIQVSAALEGDAWVFSVTDNGIGFESKDAENVFLMFRRLHSEEKYSGTGLGLGICRKIVEQYGGRIWAESAPGQGATFFFTLPARKK